MNRAYDRDKATQLVPLLEAIFEEVAERRREVRLLEKQMVRAKREASHPEEIARLQARLSTHRRELRLARREFERLGCVVDENDPNRVIIPGSNGALERGFHWAAGESDVTRLVTDSPTG